MQTVREQNGKGISPAGYKTYQSQAPVSANQEKLLKIREFRSWSVCFSVIVLLTGLLKFLKLGITMETVTSGLFYTSLCGLVYFIYRIVSLSRTPVQLISKTPHELN